MTRSIHPLSWLSGALVVASICGATPSAAEKVESLPIVDRAIELHGGEVWSNAEIQLRITSRSGAYDLVIRNREGRFHYIVQREREGVVTTWEHTNERVEKRIGDEVVPLLEDEDRRVAEDFVSSRVYFASLPFRLDDPGVYKEDQGLEEWNGRQLRRVKVSFEPGTSTNAQDEYLYWFDPDTARMEQFAYSFSGGLRFRPLIDYRRVGGILFADQENWAASGEGLEVDLIDPAFVAEKMRHLSTVRFENIVVEPLD